MAELIRKYSPHAAILGRGLATYQIRVVDVMDHCRSSEQRPKGHGVGHKVSHLMLMISSYPGSLWLAASPAGVGPQAHGCTADQGC